MKNKVCRICGMDIIDADDNIKGYWATDPNTLEVPGNEVRLVGHGDCVDTMIENFAGQKDVAIKYSTYFNRVKIKEDTTPLKR